MPDSSNVSTRKGNKIYLHVFNGKNDQLQLEGVPGCAIQKAYFLKGGAVQFQQTEKYIVLSWKGALPDSNDTVIVLEMDHTVENIPLITNSVN
jgi:alpha-L-fucosidase